MNHMNKLSIVIIICLLCNYTFAQQVTKCYVSLNGSDNNDGSITQPFASINKAQQFVRNSIKQKNGTYQIILRGGTYMLAQPLSFNAQDDVNAGSTLEFTAYPGEKVTISGGKTLSGSWVKTSKPGIWRLKLEATYLNKGYFQALFANNKRLKRAASDTLFSKGPIPEYGKLYSFLNFDAIKRLVKDSINTFCGFVYTGKDLSNLKDISNAEVIVYNSWEASWHKIYRIDTARKIVYFKNPATYPVGFFSPKVRYRVENAADYLTKPGEWYFDNTSNTVFYYAGKGENPNQIKFVAPWLDTLLIAKGDAKANKYVSNIKFSGIDFSYSKSAWGVNLYVDDYKKQAYKPYPELDLSQGFSSIQASFGCGEALVLKACQNIIFNNCNFTHLGNYALGIKEYSDNCTISNCKINDIGGGGIVIGFNYIGAKNADFPDNISPSGNKVINCVINNCGVIFPSGVGIGIIQANHTIVSHNRIYDLPYSGISTGWIFSYQDNYTSYNEISYNHIYNVMKILTDGGGIYTLGKQTGTIYKGNYIHDIYRSAHAIGANSNGFFFDQCSSAFRLDSNVVYNIKNELIRYNQAKATDIQLEKNYFEKSKSSNQLVNAIYKKIPK